MAKWHYPLDPLCPTVYQERRQMAHDPFLVGVPDVRDDLWQDFEASHRKRCPRCLEYGLANVGVED